MKSKFSQHAKKIVLYLAICSFVIAVIEGYCYYSEYSGRPFFQFLLVALNAFKAFGFHAAVTLDDVLKKTHGDAGVLRNAIDYAYGIACLIAPFCTVAFLYKLVDQVFRLHRHIHQEEKREHILVCGYNVHVRDLLEDADTKGLQKIRLVVSSPMDSPEKTALMERGVSVHSIDLLELSDSRRDAVLQELELDKTEAIVLLGSSAENFSLFYFFQQNKSALRQDVKFFISCDNDGVYHLLEDSYEQAMIDKTDLEVFSIPELQVREMYREYPLHTYYVRSGLPPEQWHTHLLVLGLGRVGQQAVLQAMNFGVVHSENEILIDVVDYDIERQKNLFANRFNPNYVNLDKDTFRIPRGHADGELCIRFHQMDIRFGEFGQLLQSLEQERPITYAVIAMSDADTGVYCMTKLQQLHRQGTGRMPVILRMDKDLQMAKYLTENEQTLYSDIHILRQPRQVIRLRELLATEMDSYAKDFNLFYSTMDLDAEEEADVPTPSPEALRAQRAEVWRERQLFQRDSSRALSYHYDMLQTLRATCIPAGEWAHWTKEALCDAFGQTGRPGKYGRMLGSKAANRWAIDGLKFLDDPPLRECAKQGHRRWCYFMASHGWGHIDGKKNPTARLSPYMTDWAALVQKYPYMCKYDLMPLLMQCRDNYE